MSELREPLYWSMTSLVHEAAVEGMANRANFDLEKAETEVDFIEAHGGPLKRYNLHDQLFQGAMAFMEKIGNPISGTLIDLGSGTGVGACIFSKFERINEILAVEVSEPFVTDVMPEIFEKYDAKLEKIQRVVGDFNALKVEDASINAIIEIDSLHHSEDLDVTLKECNRVLKPGGAIIAVDRAWPDETTQEQLEAKLNKEFPDHVKERYNIPLTESFTRRDWGEHEYTIRQWFDYFERQGFDPAILVQHHPPALNSIFLKLPTFDFSISRAAVAYQRGQRRLKIYGFSGKRVMFIAIKKG